MTERTYDETCPSCGATIDNLWDNDWQGKAEIEIDCSSCGATLSVSADTSFVIEWSTEVEG